jgi:arylsulfatase A-like enzyme
MTRTMKIGFIFATMLLLAVFGERYAPAAEPAKRPNIVVILADDLGFSDLGCYGSEIATPNLDRLAARGLRFTQFYNCARCCPTRAALLTGLYPHQTGVGDMEPDLGNPAYQGFLNDRCVTIAEALRPHGYRTLMSGKWNVGHIRPHWPVDRGFDHSFGLLRGASDYFDPRVGPRRNASPFALDDQPVRSFDEKFYATDAFTDHAVRWIEESAGKGPVFLYTAYTAPHSPLQARADDIAKYRGKYREGWDVLRGRRRARMIESGLLDATTPLSPRDLRVPDWSRTDDQDFQDLKMAVYAAPVGSMDRGIGRIIAALERRGVLDDTLILFLSDNGGDGGNEASTKDLPPGPKASSHIYGRPWAQLSNTPFRGYKHEMLEGGIATPLIAHWPAVIRTAGISRETGHVIDLMATCLEAAGAVYPRTHEGHAILPMEGRSLVPIFRTGKREPHDALFWEHEGNRAVRQGNWKLVAMPAGPWQLYDLAADRTEANNLAALNPAKIQELAALYEAWARRCGVLPWTEIAPAAKR